MTSMLAASADTCTLVDSLRLHAIEKADAPALTFLKHGDAKQAATLTWSELDAKVRVVAAFLQREGPSGSRAIIAAPHGPDYVVAFFACMYAGWIPVPAPAPASARRDFRLSAIAANAGALMALTSSDALDTALKSAPGLPWQSVDDMQQADVYDFQPEPLADDSIAFIQYTSGSTADPKGVIVLQSTIAAQLEAEVGQTGLTSDDTIVSWMPLYHDFGLVGHLLLGVHVGAHVVLMPPAAFLRRPAAWLEAVTQYKAALTGGPNFAFDLCCRRVTAAELTSLDLSSLKLLACGGEPVRPETLVAFAEKFAARGFEAKVLSPGYGMAESVLMITSSASETRIGLPIVTIDGRDVVSCGAVIEGHELRVVDPITFESCDDGETGELWARGPSVAAGYWQRDAESAEVFGATAADGSGPWLRTGDLGLLHEGAVVVTGRRKELIIVRGHNHYPTDIEHTAQCSHEALEPGAGAAFSVSTPAGERVVLVQEISRAARRHVDAAQLIDGLRMAVSEEHGIALHAVVLVEPLSVPKTSSGKVQRLLCKERWLDGSLMVVASEGATVATAAPSTALDPQLVSEVLTLVARESRRESVALDGVLRGNVGFDSLGFVELIVTVEDELKVKISEDLAAKIATVGDLAHVVAASRIAKTEVGITDIRSHMMEQIPQLRVEVEEQRGRDLLVDGRWIADFASANYLGLDLHPDVIASVQPAIEKWGVHPSWTRIVASPAIYGTLERKIATFIGAPDVLVFPTVTLLHAGMLPLLAGPRGAIFVDKEAHASVHDGAALAATRGATVIVYEHGDHEALAALLAESTAPAKIIATDGVYSMSADYEDLHTLVALAKKHDARLYVDDAHGFGVVGANPTSSDPYGAGNGLVARAGLGYAADNIIYVAGMSKAFSSLAAFVTCADAAEKMLFATAGTAVFTGPCPTASLATAIAGIDVVAREGAELRSRLHALTTKLVNGARALGFAVDNHDAFPLIGVVIGKTSATISACRTLWDHGILITPGLFPATPHDRGLLRFTLTAANTEAQVERALDALADVRGVLPKSGTMLKAA